MRFSRIGRQLCRTTTDIDQLQTMTRNSAIVWIVLLFITTVVQSRLLMFEDDQLLGNYSTGFILFSGTEIQPPEPVLAPLCTDYLFQPGCIVLLFQVPPPEHWARLYQSKGASAAILGTNGWMIGFANTQLDNKDASDILIPMYDMPGADAAPLYESLNQMLAQGRNITGLLEYEQVEWLDIIVSKRVYIGVALCEVLLVTNLVLGLYCWIRFIRVVREKGIKLVIPHIVLAFIIFGTLCEIVSVVDLAGINRLYSYRTSTIFLILPTPFIFSATLLMTFTWTSIRVNPFLHKAKIPFFVLCGLHFILVGIASALQVTTITFWFNFVIISYGVAVISSLAIFFTVTAVRVYKQLQKSSTLSAKKKQTSTKILRTLVLIAAALYFYLISMVSVLFLTSATLTVFGYYWQRFAMHLVALAIIVSFFVSQIAKSKKSSSSDKSAPTTSEKLRTGSASMNLVLYFLTSTTRQMTSNSSMVWCTQHPEANFPPELHKDSFPNLWLKNARTDRVPISENAAKSSFNKLTQSIKNHTRFKSEVDWTDLEDFNAEKSVKLIERFMNEVLYPKLEKAFLDPVGHTSFGAKELRQAWLNCRHIDWTGFTPQEQKDYDLIFRIDPYGNVISLFAKPNSPVAPAFDHFFPFIRGGRTRDRAGSKETNIILIQWKANSKKSDVIEQLIPPHFLQTGVTPDQLQSALRSNNGFYGVPALPFFLGYDPVLDSETLPDRAIFFENWLQTMKDDVYNALRRLRQAELTREQKYVSRKEAKGNRRGVRVNPYSFSLSDSRGSSSPSKADPKFEEKLEYKVFLKACLIDDTISPQEEKEIQQLRQKYKISDALHEETLKQLGYTLDDYKKALEEGVEDESDKYETFLKTAMIDKNMDKKERQALEEVRKQIGIVTEEHKYLEEEYKKKDSLIEIDKLSQLTVAELKERCKELELKLSGKKDELIERIKAKLSLAPVVSSTAQSPTTDQKELTVAQLKTKLRELNLEVSGTKQQLKERLENHVVKKPAQELTKEQLLVDIKKAIPSDVVIPVKTKKSVLEEIYAKVVKEDLDKLTKQQMFDKLKEMGVKELPNQKETKENLIALYKRQIIQQCLNNQKVDSPNSSPSPVPVISTSITSGSSTRASSASKLTVNSEKSAVKSSESGTDNLTKEQLRKALEEKGVKFARKKETKETYSQLYNTIVLNNEGQTNDQIRELLKKEGVDSIPAKATKKELNERLKVVLLKKVE